MKIKIWERVRKNKVGIGLLIFVVVGGGYSVYKAVNKDGEAVSYLTAEVRKGALITSISGNGQVSASNQIDIKSKVSGDITSVSAEDGQEIKKDAVIATIDTADAVKSVRDAQTALETAKLELEELIAPPDELDLLKAENNLAQAQETERKAEDNIGSAYENAFTAIANSFLDFPNIISEVRDILYGTEISDSEPALSQSWNTAALKNSISPSDFDERHGLDKLTKNAEDNYADAKEKYDKNFSDYKNSSRYSSQETIDDLLDETLETAKSISETIKSEINVMDYWTDYRSQKDLRIYPQVTAYQSNLKSYTSTVNGDLSSIMSSQDSIKNSKDSLLSAQRSIEELKLSLKKLKEGADSLTIRAQNISIQQKEDALADAQQALADHYLRAPFEGVITDLSVEKGESVSVNSAVATLLSQQKVAEITLNEIDAVDVKTGQKATLTFDAIENLMIRGEVAEVDILGTESQGVVTYNAKISFDTQDERVKPGMSVSASIITNQKQDVLTLPNSSIKYQGNLNYVEVINNDGTITPQPVELGLSNDTMTEVTGGLQEGEKVVTQTINSSGNSSTNTLGNTPTFRAGVGGSVPTGGTDSFRAIRQISR